MTFAAAGDSASRAVGAAWEAHGFDPLLSPAGFLSPRRTSQRGWAPVRPAAGSRAGATLHRAVAPELLMFFEENRGQYPRDLLYAARNHIYGLGLQRDGIYFFGAPAGGRQSRPLALRFVGGQAASLEGRERLTARIAHLQAGRRVNEVAAYRKVRYRDLWEGVDLEIYSNEARFEYDFIIQPGSHPSRIRLRVDGADGVSLDEQGDLIVEAWGLRLRHRAPVAYQEVDGERISVASAFRLHDGHTVSIETSSYRRDLPLIIDPVFVYSSYLGGAGFDEALSIVSDSAGNLYLAGVTASWDFPLAGAALQRHLQDLDIFLAKLNPAGTELLYATYIGGTGTDTVAGIAVDEAGTMFVAGSTDSGNFPVSPGAAYPTYQCCGGDGFALRLSADGSTLLYATFLGGAGSDFIQAIAVDASGALYFAGLTNSKDLPVTANAPQRVYGGGEWDGFAGKLNPAGTQLSWLTYLGGSADEVVRAAALDGAGQLYLGGSTRSADFPVTPQALRRTLGGTSDGFIVAVNAAGNAFVYATLFGGAGQDEITALKALPSGEAIIAGRTDSLNLPVTPGVYRTTAGPGFLARLDPMGAALRFSTFLDVVPAAMDREPGGRILLVGGAASGLAASSDAYARQVRAVSHPLDAFLCLVDAEARGVEYATYFGGGSEDRATSLTLVNGAVWIAGLTRSRDLPVGPAALRLAPGGPPQGEITDAFLARMELNRPPIAVTTTPASLLFVQQWGGAAAPAQEIRLVAAEAGVAYRARALSSGWLKLSGVEGMAPAGAAASVTVSVDAQGLAEGTYEAEVLIQLLGAAPGTRIIPVRLLVVRQPLGLKLDRSSVDLVTQVGTNPPPVEVWVSDTSSSGSEGIAFDVSYNNVGTVWFSVAPRTARTRAPLTITISATHLPAGNYQAVVTLTPLGVHASPLSFLIRLAVRANASLRLVPPVLNFSYQAGGKLPAPQVLEVQSTGEPLRVQLRRSPETAGWLNFPEPQGLTPLAQYVAVKPAGLAPGTYQAQIEVTAPDAANSPQLVPVTLTISGAAALSSSTTSLRFAARRGAAPPQAQWLPLSSAPSNVSFRAQATTESGGAWLSVSPDSGATPANLAVTVRHGLLNAGVYRGAILVSLASSDTVVLQIPVTLEVQAGTPPAQTKLGVFRRGLWLLDANGNGSPDGPPSDITVPWGQDGDIPVTGDWNGDGRAKIGVYSNGFWFLDYNGDGVWDGGMVDKRVGWGWPGATPVLGDWNGDGRTKIGVYSAGFWFLDYDGDYLWNPSGADKQVGWGWPGATPVVGDWNGDGRTKVGVYSAGFWFLDYDGDYLWNPAAGDKQVGWGWAGVQVVTGDWNGDGRTKIGVFSEGTWVLDFNGNYEWDGLVGGDRLFELGSAGETPVVGDWNGDGCAKAGTFRAQAGVWYLDYNGNGVWEGALTDRMAAFGAAGDLPVTGRWTWSGETGGGGGLLGETAPPR